MWLNVVRIFYEVTAPHLKVNAANVLVQFLKNLPLFISVPTEEMCSQFNDLRSDMVLLYELKNALTNCEHELQTLKATYEALCPGV